MEAARQRDGWGAGEGPPCLVARASRPPTPLVAHLAPCGQVGRSDVGLGPLWRRVGLIMGPCGGLADDESRPMCRRDRVGVESSVSAAPQTTASLHPRPSPAARCPSAAAPLAPRNGAADAAAARSGGQKSPPPRSQRARRPPPGGHAAPRRGARAHARRALGGAESRGPDGPGADSR